MIESFERKLQKYADVIVRIGLNVQPGQNLVIGGSYIRGVDIGLAPFVRLIAVSAYQAGARYVDAIWEDPASRVIRFKEAPRDSFEYLPDWPLNARLGYLNQGDAFLILSADNPDLLKGQEPKLIGQEMQAISKAVKPVRAFISRNAVNRCVAPAAVGEWAAFVYPDLPSEQQVESLWNAIFKICRIDRDDPVGAWKTHIESLMHRARYLNSKAYDAIHYTGPDTDLTVGLPTGATWECAGARSESGIDFLANLPTEEVFTIPHRERIDGTIRSTRPLNLSSLVDDFSLTFEKGRVIKATAKRGEEVLKQLLSADENASSLGEVSFVPYSSQISLTNTLFYNTVIDENAASHLALGNSYRFCLKDSKNLTDDQYQAAGGNISGVHADFMVGSSKLDIDGLTREGLTEPIMRLGEWAFDV